jgi:hypothetical protein
LEVSIQDEDETVQITMYGIDVAEDRRVQGGLLPGVGYGWLFTNAGRETRISLTPEAMDAVIRIYALMLSKQTTAEVTWDVEEKEGAIIATADPTDSGAG